MRALESSPVHCLKPWPWGNWWRPEKGATTAMLIVCMIRAWIDTTIVGECTVNQCHRESYSPSMLHAHESSTLPPTRRDGPWSNLWSIDGEDPVTSYHVCVTISFHAYHIRTSPTFSYLNPRCHSDIIMTPSPPMTSSLHHYDLTSYRWPHFTPLLRHH